MNKFSLRKREDSMYLEITESQAGFYFLRMATLIAKETNQE